MTAGPGKCVMRPLPGFAFLPELMRCRAIAVAGTSADMQIALLEAHDKAKGPAQALRAVTDWIAAETLQ